MNIFGLTIKRTPTAQLSGVGSNWANGFRSILEAFPGAWQRNIEEKRGDLLTYPTLYACITRIASDIGKLPFTLQATAPNGITTQVTNPAYSPVLRKPNNFQTEGQFREYYQLTKLIHGNTYVLKRRDQRGVVTDMYVLDPNRVMPMVSELGQVFYQLQTDAINSLPADYPAANLIVPASEIIHDRCATMHHPLIGVPPIAAAYWPALKNMKIMRNATVFFANNSQPGGILTAPAGMTEEDAKAVQVYWDGNFNNGNSGRVAIIGADMKFTPFAMKSIDSQMVEQMSYSDQQICQPFGITPFKVGIGEFPRGLTVDDLNQLYYSDALQPHIEHMEALLTDGLNINAPLSLQLCLDPLLRMNETKRADIETKLVAGKIKTPDEGRASFNLAPTGGGDTLWGQQQDSPLGILAEQAANPPAPSVADSATSDTAEADESSTDEAQANQQRQMQIDFATMRAIKAAYDRRRSHARSTTNA